jgi:hypothetical protein
MKRTGTGEDGLRIIPRQPHYRLEILMVERVHPDLIIRRKNVLTVTRRDTSNRTAGRRVEAAKVRAPRTDTSKAKITRIVQIRLKKE